MHILKGLSRIVGVAAGVWCGLASIYLAVGPIGSGLRVTHTDDGRQIQETFTTTLWETNGWWGLFVLLVAATLGVVGGWAAWTDRGKLLWVSAGLLLLGSLVAGFSIGPAYLPAALLLLSTGAARALAARGTAAE